MKKVKISVSLLTLNEQQAPAPLPQDPLFVPPLFSHTLGNRQVPDSLLSPLQAVFANLVI